MARFRRLSDVELYDKELGGLLGHLRAARAAGDADQEKLATDMIAFKEHDRILDKVRGAYGWAPEWAIDEIAGKAFESALRQRWRGETRASHRAWVNRIIGGEAASFFRTARGEAMVREHRLDAGADDERSRHELLGGHGSDDALLEGLERSLHLDAAEAELGELEGRNPLHARVVALALWDDRPAREVAGECDTSPENVDQIKRRFRVALRERLRRAGWEDS